jgi:hypothetical protein
VEQNERGIYEQGWVLLQANDRDREGLQMDAVMVAHWAKNDNWVEKPIS